MPAAPSNSTKLHPNAKDLKGLKFGKLTVLEFAGRKPQGRLIWKCQCECGNVKAIVGTEFTSGNTKSCGCSKDIGDMYNSPEYYSWRSMLNRVRNPKYACYDDYGGRGITVCERWKSFNNFYADMGPRPTGHTIERIKNHLGYCPENCKWATPKEQGRNKRNNVILEFRGESKCVSDWVEMLGEKLGITNELVLNRLRAGWTADRILTTPVGPTGPASGKKRKPKQ